MVKAPEPQSLRSQVAELKLSGYKGTSRMLEVWLTFDVASVFVWVGCGLTGNGFIHVLSTLDLEVWGAFFSGTA